MSEPSHEIGENLLWKWKTAQKMNKVSPTRKYGIFVGLRARSGELWVAMPEGVRKVLGGAAQSVPGAVVNRQHRVSQAVAQVQGSGGRRR